MRLRTILIAIGLLAVVSSVYGRTWHVERDGSGDFVVIQDAVDAASAGDVIQLGPGRYDEWQPLPGYPNTVIYVLVEKDLSFIGAGTGATIIGPASLSVHSPSTYEVTGIRFRGTSIRGSLADLTIENCRGHGVLAYNGRLEVDRCEFRDCVSFGILGHFVDGGWIRNCQFIDIGDHGYGTSGVGVDFAGPSQDFEVAQCTFANVIGYGVGAWSSCNNIAISDCAFDGGIVGAAFTDGASGSIRNCQIANCSNAGISLLQCGNVVVEGNLVSGDGYAGIGVLYSADSLIMRQNIVTGCYWVLYFNARVDAGEVSNNHFLRTADTAYWVWVEDYFPVANPYTINLENNYWGTTDTELVDQWIYDGYDDEDVDVYIDYLPIADGPVETETTAWGALKSLFR